MNENETMKPDSENPSTTPKTKKQLRAEAKAQMTTKQRVWAEIREWATSLAIALVVVLVIRTFLFMPIRVEGDSMFPTLHNQQHLGTTVYDVRLVNTLARGDVVICHYPGRYDTGILYQWFGIKIDTNFVKRVVGLPGDVVKRVSGVTYVNDVPLDARARTNYTAKSVDGVRSINGYALTLTDDEARRYKFDYEYTLGADEYFVVGDNRYNSHDSRAWNGPDFELHVTNDVFGEVGPITSDMIVSKAHFVMWPIGSWGAVENNPNYTAD